MYQYGRPYGGSNYKPNENAKWSHAKSMRFAKGTQTEVNSLLDLCDVVPLLNDFLPHVNTLCVLTGEPQDHATASEDGSRSRKIRREAKKTSLRSRLVDRHYHRNESVYTDLESDLKRTIFITLRFPIRSTEPIPVSGPVR